MKTYLGILISIFLICKTNGRLQATRAANTNGQRHSDSTGKVTDIAKSVFRWFYGEEKANVAVALVGLFSKDEEKSKDLTAADELIRGLTFDLFDEKISCRVSRGISLNEFPHVIYAFARRFSIPDEVKDTLLVSKYADDLSEIVLNFKFKKGETGSFVYGRVATIKHGEKIDMAYSVYTLEFKISPTVTRYEKERTLLWLFTLGTEVWHEKSERNLSTKEKDNLKDYFMKKAIAKFRSEYAPLLQSSQYCDGNIHC